MSSSCDALPYHWNPTSMAERVGLPPCNSSPTLNILTHRFSTPPISPVSKSCGDGGVAKRQVEMQLTDHPSRGRFTKNQQKKLLVGAWNVHTLLERDNAARPEGRTALIAKELARYRIDIAALSETRLADEGTLKEDGGGYTFFWHGKPEAEERLHGVGFAVRTNLMKSIPSLPVGINEWLMKLRLPLTKSRHLTIISAYTLTLTNFDETWEKFYEDLDQLIRSTSPNDMLLIMGDFNARVGKDQASWKRILGSQGVGKMNSNGLLLPGKMCQTRAMHHQHHLPPSR